MHPYVPIKEEVTAPQEMNKIYYCKTKPIQKQPPAMQWSERTHQQAHQTHTHECFLLLSYLTQLDWYFYFREGDDTVALTVTVRSYDLCPKVTDSEVHDFQFWTTSGCFGKIGIVSRMRNTRMICNFEASPPSMIWFRYAYMTFSIPQQPPRHNGIIFTIEILDFLILLLVEWDCWTFFQCKSGLICWNSVKRMYKSSSSLETQLEVWFREKSWENSVTDR